MHYLSSVFSFIMSGLTILTQSDVGIVFFGAAIFMAAILLFNRLLHL